jgi:alpha-tubulin suppressor-like RCC1 family protein
MARFRFGSVFGQLDENTENNTLEYLNETDLAALEQVSRSVRSAVVGYVRGRVRKVSGISVMLVSWSKVLRLLRIYEGGRRAGYQRVNAGNDHTLAVTSGGGVLAWGMNDENQLHSGKVSTNRPMSVPGLTNVVSGTAGVQYQ